MLFQKLFKRSGKKTYPIKKNINRGIDPLCIEIVKQLQKSGYESYVVGGCVRDLLLENKPKDFDIATAASPQVVRSLIKRSFIIGRRFKIVHAKTRYRSHEYRQCSAKYFPIIYTRPIDHIYEITTFRRKPEMVNDAINENVYGGPKEDAFRRDFTLNGLFFDPVKSEVVDYVDGMSDLKNKSLRIIGDPKTRFAEDPIRILRALRFAAKKDFTIDKKTQKGILSTCNLVASAKRERIREEVLKLLKSGHMHSVLERYQKFNIWPQLSKSFDLSSKEKYQELSSITKAIQSHKWENPHKLAPLFYLLLSPFFDINRQPLLLEKFTVDFRIFKSEAEDIARIHNFLKKLKRHINKPLSLSSLCKTEANIDLAIQSFYVLFVLAEAKIKPFQQIWQHYSKDWRDFAGTLKFNQLNASLVQKKKRKRSSSRRRKR